MLPHNLEEVNVNRWWWLKRLQYNKGLLLSGAITFVIVGLICTVQPAYIVQYIFPLFGIIYTVYVVIANILFTLGWVLDIAFNRYNDDNFREIIFKLGYWLSVLAPPAVVLIYIITMFSIAPAPYPETQAEFINP